MTRLIPLLLLALALPAQANEQLDALLESVKKGQAEARVVNAEREKRFERNRAEQKKLLDEARREVAGYEKRAETMRKTFTANEKAIRELRESLKEKSGDLEQLKSVVRQAATDAHTMLTDSQVTAQYPQRLELLADLSIAERLPAPEDIEALWYEIQREMTENGRVVEFSTEVFDVNGAPDTTEVQRIGLFAMRADGDYLEYRPEERRLEMLRQQPSASGPAFGVLGGLPEGMVLLDPTRGTLFGLLVERPGLLERLRQGGFVGYLILGLGAVGLILVVFQLVYLTRVGGRMRRQLKNLETPSEDNPLGRVLRAGRGLGGTDIETAELQLDEAILKETPKLERLQGTIKLLAAVAPLMGLLGTVTGMIETFQAITLFGTGDPKLMASGISQALVTTVLGLVVAIPLLFLHSLVATRGRALIQILDEQTAGLIARAQERSAAPQANTPADV